MKVLNLLMLALLLPLASAFAAGDRPCKELHEQIVKACEAQGFTKGGHKEKKGLWIDCVGVIKKGGTVPGVTPDAALTQACNAKKEKREEKKEEKKADKK